MLPVPDFKTRTYTSNNQNDLNMVGKVKIKILVIVSFVFFSLVFAQLVFANNLATDGQKIADVYSQINKLNQENTQLEVEIAKNSSFSTLSNQAQLSGFKKPVKIITP